MLLRLVPPAPLPTILFTLSFPTLPPSLPLPASWDAHLQLLADTHLASPPSLHALDKSVAWTALLDTVTFDLATLTVTCIFIDGTNEEWPLTNRCVDLLESVIRDVNRSAVEAESEQQQRDVLAPREREPSSSSSSSEERECPPEEPVPMLPPQKMPKAKKRRSLLASLMASLVPSSSFSPPAASLRPPTPPLPPTPAPPPEELLICNGILASRFLRRRARSTLVDAFRRFVIAELSARFAQPPHYALWAARSTMRRAAEEMARVVEGALHHPHTHDDEDRDDGSASSMTDGSSVHTPLDSHDAPAPRAPAKRACPRPAVLAPDAYQTYISLKALHARLYDLAGRLAGHAAAPQAGDAAVLAVRSRRRAWSARAYLDGGGRGGASMALVGFAVPARPSPLCRSWTADDVERAPEREQGRGRAVQWDRGGLLLRRARSLWDERAARCASALRSREAEDVDELARDVEGRLSFGAECGTRVGYYEVDEDDEDEDGDGDGDERAGAEEAYEAEFELNPARGTRLVELARPMSPPPVPWSRPHPHPHPKMVRPKPLAVAVAAVEDALPVSTKLL